MRKIIIEQLFNSKYKFTYMKFGIFIILTLCSCINAFSTNYSIKHYANEQGFHLSSIRALAQDNMGFIWIGAENGLVRFDGLRFKKIQAPKGYVVVNDIKIDPHNRIWVKWRNHPIKIYYPLEKIWKDADTITNNSVNFLNSHSSIYSFDYINSYKILLDVSLSIKDFDLQLYKHLKQKKYKAYSYIIT